MFWLFKDQGTFPSEGIIKLVSDSNCDTMTSLHALPTELDEQIIRYLNTADTARLSCVSKYYRRVAEPYLYDSIELCSHDCNRIKLLLLALIRRKDLGQMIHHFELRQDGQPEDLGVRH
jgi:hypothetical protein